MSPRRVVVAGLLLVLVGLAACGGGDGAGEVPPGVELRLHGSGGEQPVAGARVGPLLAALDALVAAARPAELPYTRRAIVLAHQRGALEFRFATPRLLVDAAGDTLSLWRVLVPLGAEPHPPGREGSLLFLGYPDWQAAPLLSSRGRGDLIEALER